MLYDVTHILLDGARMEKLIEEPLKMNAEHECLYSGAQRDRFGNTAPFIFDSRNKNNFINWYVGKGWDKSWGVMLKSVHTTSELSKHFRKFIKVKTEDHRDMFFRFYDPRVLRIFLPTCDHTQLHEFFGPVEYFLMEGEDPGHAVYFWLENGHLNSHHIERKQLLNYSPMPAYSGGVKHRVDAATANPPVTHSNATTVSPVPQHAAGDTHTNKGQNEHHHKGISHWEMFD